VAHEAFVNRVSLFDASSHVHLPATLAGNCDEHKSYAEMRHILMLFSGALLLSLWCVQH